MAQVSSSICSSSSSSAAVLAVEELPLFTVVPTSPTPTLIEEYKGYNLLEMAESVGLKLREGVQMNDGEKKGKGRKKGKDGGGKSGGGEKGEEEKSEALCCRYLETFREVDSTVELQVRERIKQLEYIPPIYCTTDECPDVAIIRKCDGLTLLLVEIHSSTYEKTIRKCLLGVSDLLRLHRAHDRNVSRCCGFAFPKLPGKQPNKQCVVKVEVSWENLHFQCSLTPFEHSLEARAAIMEELEKAKRNAPSPGSPLKEKEKYVIRLAEKDLKIFGEGTVQVNHLDQF